VKCEYEDGVYRATRHDAVMMSEMFFLSVLDLPFALVTDTLILPYDIVLAINKKYEKEQRNESDLSNLHTVLVELNMSSPINCPSQIEPKIEKWSYGYERYCEKDNIKDGPWEAWLEQQIRIKGAYKHGLAHGEWVYLDSVGTVKCTIGYSEGTVVSKNIMKPLKDAENSSETMHPCDWVTGACGIVIVPEKVAQ